jgi:hypothetical protein
MSGMKTSLSLESGQSIATHGRSKGERARQALHLAVYPRSAAHFPRNRTELRQRRRDGSATPPAQKCRIWGNMPFLRFG